MSVLKKHLIKKDIRICHALANVFEVFDFSIDDPALYFNLRRASLLYSLKCNTDSS